MSVFVISLFCFKFTKPHEYDFIVVGSGSGSIVASRLAEANHKVLLLEAGPNDLTFSCTDCGTILPNGDFIEGIPLLPKSEFLQTAVKDINWDAFTPNDTGQFWNYNQSQLFRSNENLYRAKILGGCSSHNGMVWTRFGLQCNEFQYSLYSLTKSVPCLFV